MKNKCSVILAGGLGTRMGKLTKTSPKTLVKVMGKPILWYIIKELLRNKFDKIIITLGYKGDKIKKYIEATFPNEISKICMVETGKFSSIPQRIDKIKSYIDTDSFLLTNGDALFEIDYKKKKKYFDKLKLDALLFSFSMIANFGIMELNRHNKISKFNKNQSFDLLTKKNKKKESLLIPYTGMAIIKKELLNTINFKNKNDFEIFFFNNLIRKKKVDFTRINRFWFSFDSQKDLDMASIKESFLHKSIYKIKNNYK